MSAKLIMILVGFALLAIALIGIAKSAMKSKVGIPIGIIGVILLFYGSYSSEMVMYNTQVEQVSSGKQKVIEEPITKVQVTYPIAQDSVKCRILTMGVYPEGHTKDIWVVLRPTDDRYYPQSDHTNTSFKIDGEWQVVTRFGGDLGEAYDIIVYEADAEASKFFSDTIEQWKQAENYPGIELASMPAGAVEVERMKVYLSKNCRGVF
jgi:hypothetical protein